MARRKRHCLVRLRSTRRLLEPGDIYPGQYEGPEFSCDSKHNIRNADDEYASSSQHLAEAVIRIKGGPGKFKITPKKKLVLVRVPIKDEWETLFVRKLKEPLAFTRNLATEPTDEEIATCLADAKVGSPYPFSSLPILTTGFALNANRAVLSVKK